MAALTTFRDPSWNAWRCALTALDSGPLTEEQAAIYRQHTGRTTLPSAPYREAHFIVGRRGGKSRAIALKAVEVSACRGYRLAPGERGVVMVVASDRQQARVVFNYIRAYISMSGFALVSSRQNASARSPSPASRPAR